MSTSGNSLRIRSEGGVVSVWLNRPEARNAMNLRMCADLIEFFGSMRSDDSVRVVVVRGEGPAFCAGIDIRELATQDAQWVFVVVAWGWMPISRSNSVRCRSSAPCMVPVVGAGCELAAACDFVVAEEGAFFQWPEALRGAVGATQRLPRAIHRAMAKELLFTSRKITAQDARAIGFVNHVTEPGGLEAAVQSRVREILACRPLAVRLMKRAVDAGEALDRVAAVQMERELIALSLQHEEWREGVSDFAPRG